MPVEPAQVFFFDVQTPLGFRVRVTHAYWQLIITIKHPVMAGREIEIQDTLADPDEVRLSRSDPNVYLFYRAQQIGRWVCAVSKREENEGFLITAYPTDAIKEGVRIWRR
jgi:hypothetical protein